jgi:thiamine biosynthesis protein ThiI
MAASPIEYHFISLLSTGLDSPVATYLTLSKGLNAVCLSFLNGGAESQINKEKVLMIGRRLVELTGSHLRIYFCDDYDSILDGFINRCDRKFTCLMCKRTMLRCASLLAVKYNAKFIVNGDILGEQASQTIDNLYVVSQSNRTIPVVRPLIGFDKTDVIKIDQKLGLYDISIMKGVGCKKNPQYPETHAKLSEVLMNEKNFDVNEVINQIMSTIDYIDL